MNLSGQVAVITGGSRGIGYAIAETVVAQGGRVCVTARDGDDLAAAVARLGGPAVALGIAGDARDEHHQDAVVDAALDQFGRMDFLVNNVGSAGYFGPLINATADDARDVFEVNVLAGLGFSRRVHAAWMGRNGGAILNIASISARGAAPLMGLYAMSKAAVMSVTEQLAYELAPTVRVNALAPAMVKTRFAAGMYEGREDQLASTYPLRRLGEPHDVARAALFLLSAESGWTTGQTLFVDGGVTLRCDQGGGQRARRPARLRAGTPAQASEVSEASQVSEASEASQVSQVEASDGV